MSISIGVLGEGYSIIAADTRVTKIAGENAGSHKDDARKLLQTEFGWVANSGGVQLKTTFFNGYLKSREIKNSDDIYTGWLRSIKEVQNFSKEHASSEMYDAVNAELASSQSVYSMNCFKDGLPVISVEAVDFMYGARILKEINSFFVHPPDRTHRVKKVIKKYAKPIKRPQDLYESINLIACLIDDISKLTDWISNTIDYGISLKVDGGILLMSIHADTETIKSTYMERGDFSELMMIKGVITPE